MKPISGNPAQPLRVWRMKHHHGAKPGQTDADDSACSGTEEGDHDVSFGLRDLCLTATRMLGPSREGGARKFNSERVIDLWVQSRLLNTRPMK
jgi:hypothetical protein